MSDRVKVGTSKVTFRVRAFDYPQIELASGDKVWLYDHQGKPLKVGK